jgi:hypothetical protein
MKSHSRSRDLQRRPAPLRPARIGLRVGQTSLTTNRNSRFTNHQSLSTLHSSLVTQRRRILIGSRPLLEIKLARSQQKRKLFLTGGFFAVLSLKGFGAIRDRGLLNHGVRNYETRTGRRDFRITKVSAPTIRPASIQYLASLPLKMKAVAMRAIAQTRDQTILEVGVMQETVALGRFFAEDYICGDVWISYRCGAESAGKT